MAHIQSIGAGVFSDLSIATPATTPNFAILDTAAEFADLFENEIQSVGGIAAAGAFVRVKNVREFPSMGTPPNIVNVPTYGQKTSQQIQGQSDAPNLEITMNFVASDWADGTVLGKMVGDGKQYVMRFSLLNAEPPSYKSKGAGNLGGTSASGAGSVENSVWYWVGKVEAIVVNPQLSDANTATITLSLQSKFFGAYTVTGSAT
jgi:hypothetical protein